MYPSRRPREKTDAAIPRKWLVGANAFVRTHFFRDTRLRCDGSRWSPISKMGRHGGRPSHERTCYERL
jgi:hypothetical protein